MKIKLLVILLVVFLVIILSLRLFFNKGFFENIVYMFAPPKDLYEYLVIKHIDILKAEAQEYQFKNKYDGIHSVGILLDNFSNELYLNKKQPNLKFKMDFYVKDKLIISCTKSEGEPFVGKRGSGYSYLVYHCPNDLPKNELVTCKVSIIEFEKEFFDKYGPVKFYVQKMSEE